MHPLVNIAITAAKKAGNIMLQNLGRLDTIHTSTKGLHDFVTDVDRKAEQEIIAIVHKAYPNHQIIAEESGTHKGAHDYIWYIDPLDGTHNYTRGLPHFSVSIGIQYKGKLEHGVVYDPIRGEIFSASRGHGARVNDRRMRVSSVTKLENSLIGTGFPVRTPKRLPTYLDIFTKLVPQLSNIRCAGSAALDLAYVAAGRLDAFYEVGLHPWDMAAGALLVKEAGGYVSDWQGGEDYLTSGNIIAATTKIHPELLGIVKGL